MILKFKKGKYFSKDGHLSDLGVAFCTDSLLYKKDNDIDKEIKSHIAECQECKHKVVDTYEFLLEENLPKEHPYFSVLNKKNGFNYGIIKVAASIMLVISLGITGLFVSKNTKMVMQNTKLSELKKDTTIIDLKEKNVLITDSIESVPDRAEIGKQNVEEIKQVQDQEFIAKADIEDKRYTLSDNQLAMIGHIMRSDYFDVISPKDYTSFNRGDKIRFSWKTDLEQSLVLKIFNNKEELVFESEPIIEKSYPLEIELEPGAYIWQVETDDDVIYIGVLYIK